MQISPQLDRKSLTSAFILERTAKRMKQFFQHELTEAGAGVTIDQWVILQSLDKEDGQNQLALAQSSYKDAPTVTRIIDLLSKKELIERHVDEKDRRRFRIKLTTKGKEKIKKVLPIIQQARAKSWSSLEEKEMDQLINSLNKVFKNIKDKK